MSVIGLMLSLTCLLMRTRSFQDLPLSTTSRGDVVPPLQSLGLVVQNSTQPIGGRVLSPSDANRTRSLAAMAADAKAKNTSAPAATAGIPFGYRFMVGPSRFCWADHRKRPLNCR